MGPSLALSRRRFVMVTAATVLTGPAARVTRALGANDRINLAVIGTGGMGTAHLRGLVERRDRDNVNVVRVCDVYRRRLDNALKLIEGRADDGTMEYREVLDDPDVDAHRCPSLSRALTTQNRLPTSSDQR